MDRRTALTLIGSSTALAIGSRLSPIGSASAQGAAAFTLPPLGYPYEALEPHIDAATMGFHHKNHHQAFITNLNGLVDKYADLKSKKPEEILGNLAGVPEAIRTPVRNSLGGHWNHSFFWNLMAPGGAKAPAGDLGGAINGAFGSLDKMQEAFTGAAMSRFGSGWAWFVVGKDKKLAVMNTPYQDTPHMEAGAKPVIGLDVWEHAYYLKYQYRRAEYVKAWWNIVNWDKAAANFKAAMS